MNRDTPKHSGKSSFIYPTQMRASREIPKMQKRKNRPSPGGFLLRDILIIIKYIVLLSLRSQTPRATWYNLKVCLSCFVC